MLRRFTFACLFLLSVAGAARAADPAKEYPDLLKQIAESAEFREAIGKSKRVVPASVWLYKDKADGKKETEFAEVLFFDYATGKTIRTRYDIAAKRIARVETLVAYPTPVADEELDRAKKIAKDKSEPLKKFLREHGADVTVGHLAPVVADPKDALYGKRVVLLIYRTKIDPKRPDRMASLNVEVNLTDEELVRN